MTSHETFVFTYSIISIPSLLTRYIPSNAYYPDNRNKPIIFCRIVFFNHPGFLFSHRGCALFVILQQFTFNLIDHFPIKSAKEFIFSKSVSLQVNRRLHSFENVESACSKGAKKSEGVIPK